MEYTIITPMEMTIASAAAATATTAKSNSGFPWLLLAMLIIGFIVCAVIATHEYDKSQFARNQASPTVA
jgi:hypothetical protein